MRKKIASTLKKKKSKKKKGNLYNFPCLNIDAVCDVTQTCRRFLQPTVWTDRPVKRRIPFQDVHVDVLLD